MIFFYYLCGYPFFIRFEGGTKNGPNVNSESPTIAPADNRPFFVTFASVFSFANRSFFIELQIITGGAEMRVKITLACSECKQRNYDTTKNKKNDPDRLEMNKYCKFCRKHTLHKETK